uniref:Uncharacterized protein n=1 Tax=Anopheles coluzzii TaxID=1518534 RepID=A0A8W7PDV0_ANOCL
LSVSVCSKIVLTKIAMSFGNVLLLTALLVGYSYWSLAQPTNLIEIRCKMQRDEDISTCKYGFYMTTCKTFACWKVGPRFQC